MAKTIEEKRMAKAQKFVTHSKTEFKKHIPRDKIKDIEITTCTPRDDAFEITGAIGATSPTGKLKTFGYTVTVNVDEAGNASFASLQVSEL